MQININNIVKLKEKQFKKLCDDIKKRDGNIAAGTRATL